MVQRFAPIMNSGGAVVSLTYLASERIIPGRPELCLGVIGGGMGGGAASICAGCHIIRGASCSQGSGVSDELYHELADSLQRGQC